MKQFFSFGREMAIGVFVFLFICVIGNVTAQGTFPPPPFFEDFGTMANNTSIVGTNTSTTATGTDFSYARTGNSNTIGTGLNYITILNPSTFGSAASCIISAGGAAMATLEKSGLTPFMKGAFSLKVKTPSSFYDTSTVLWLGLGSGNNWSSGNNAPAGNYTTIAVRINKENGLQVIRRNGNNNDWTTVQPLTTNTAYTITVLFNATSGAIPYGTENESLPSNKCHIYVNGTKIEEYPVTVDNYAATSFKIYAQTGMFEIDDIAVYDALPTVPQSCTTEPTLGDVTNADETTSSSISLSAELKNEGDCPVTEYGFVYNTTGNPRIETGTKVEAEDLDSDIFSAEISGLSCGTKYYFRAYATNDKGTSYSDEDVEITTLTATYTVTLNAGTGSVAQTEYPQSYCGEAITLPDATTTCDGWEFAGWKNGVAVNETYDTQTLISAGTFFPTENTTLYAVYTKQESVYDLVTASNQITNGIYLLGTLYDSEYYLFDGTLSNTSPNLVDGNAINTGSSTTSFSIFEEEQPAELTFVSTGTANQYYIKLGNDYLGVSANDSRKLAIGTIYTDYWTVTYSGSFTLNYHGSTNGQMRAYQGTFRNYVNAYNDAVVLFRKNEVKLYNSKPCSTLTWLGTTNEWENAENWTPEQVPSSSDNIIIPAAATNYPVLAANVTLAGVTIEPGASIELGDFALETNGIKVQTKVNAGQWYSIGFPFAVTKVYSEQFEDELKAGTDFWLREFVGTVPTYFTPTNGIGSLTIETLEAGKGYIIQLPVGYTDNSVISYSSGAATVQKSTHPLTFGSDYALQANPTLAPLAVSLEANQHIYTLQEDGTAYLKADATEIAPFEAVITVEKADAPNRISLNTDVVTGITTVLEDDAVIAIHYYNLQGMEVAKLQRNGIYLVKSVFQSGKREVIKAIIR